MHRDPTLLHIKPPSLQVRRHEGYAASERRRQDLQVCLCSVRDGEVLGDVELALNLSTYLQTVVCTTETQVTLFCPSPALCMGVKLQRLCVEQTVSM